MNLGAKKHICDTITRWWDFIKRNTEKRKYGRKSAPLELPQQLMTPQKTWSGTATLFQNLLIATNCATERTTVMCRLLRSTGLKHKQWSLTKHSCVVPKRSSARVVMKISCCTDLFILKVWKRVACSAVKLLVLPDNFWLLMKKPPPSSKLKEYTFNWKKLKILFQRVQCLLCNFRLTWKKAR